MLRLLKSKLGQQEAVAARKIIALTLMALTILVVAVIYYYSTAQSERVLYNLTRVFRGFR